MKRLYYVAIPAEFNRTDIVNYLEKIPQCIFWFYSLPNSFFMYSTFSAFDLYEKIVTKFGKKDGLFVMEIVAQNCQGLLPQEHWDIIHHPERY